MRLQLVYDHAAFCALDRTEKSMLVLLTWHSLACLIVVSVGAVLGQGLLGW
ncbi:NrsF family protein [Bosea sp. R86505]|uniref:NrsF family protein n=1 Tax=Bosea sp. R86505 TaxID=3101710 RepID=UPI00366E0B31